MPKYRFKCKKCRKEQTFFVSTNYEFFCEECGGSMKRQLPKLNGPAEVKETVDSFLGTKHRQDQKEMIRERNDEYFWRVQVPRLAADPTYSLETKIENGWVWVDDSGKVHVNDKPPSKR